MWGQRNCPWNTPELITLGCGPAGWGKVLTSQMQAHTCTFTGARNWPSSQKTSEQTQLFSTSLQRHTYTQIGWDLVDDNTSLFEKINNTMINREWIRQCIIKQWNNKMKNKYSDKASLKLIRSYFYLFLQHIRILTYTRTFSLSTYSTIDHSPCGHLKLSVFPLCSHPLPSLCFGHAEFTFGHAEIIKAVEQWHSPLPISNTMGPLTAVFHLLQSPPV